MTARAGHEPITGLILAGGAGRRMGGRDKGLALLDGIPLAARVLARLAPQVREVLISANRNARDYSALGVPVVCDRLPGFVGPLAGLDAGFAAAPADSSWIATCPCDAPFLPQNLVGRLLAAVQDSGASIAMASTGSQNHPVFLLAHRRTAPAVAEFLAAGERRVLRWVQAQHHVIVPFNDCPDAFANFNSDAEIAAAEASLRTS
ncbi:MAG: molybdenum cofactor guanylyltransferase [Zoogloeaceae bacterium]|nr:molybdenum cofactor guanylyltransferase [Zoogloeaceae bacterium]